MSGKSSSPKAAVTGSKSPIPLSENQRKFHADWTAKDCIAELQRVANIDTDKVISRNYFRVHSQISESTWNQFFGTFSEFKRQSGIILTRQQHQLEREIAKHASVDHYRKLNVERADWGSKYIRNNPTRFKTAIFFSDLHDEEVDPFYMRVLIDTVKRVKPDLMCLVGDGMDLPEFGKYTVDPREWSPVGRIQFMHKNVLRPLRSAAPDAQFDYIEGNHEARLLRLLADATPALRAVLSDLHGMTIGKLLGLDEFEINYVAKADLSTYTKRDFDSELRNNYRIYWGSVLAHHFPQGRNMGLPGVNGHHHKHISWPMFNPIYGAYEWHQMGCGHRRSASYCEGEHWHMGFDIVHVDTLTRATVHDYVTVSDFAVAGGKFYYREKTEASGSPVMAI